MNTSNKNKINVLGLGLDNLIADVIKQSILEILLDLKEYNIEKILESPDPFPDIIIGGSLGDKETIIETAQAIRMQQQDATLYYVTRDSKFYNKKKLIKNGFKDAFLLPMEQDFFLKSLKIIISNINSSINYFEKVKAIDLKPEQILPFNTWLYLPINKKYLLFSKKGETISEEKTNKLKDTNLKNLFVSLAEKSNLLGHFKSNHTEKDQEASELSFTEKDEKISQATRELMGDIFSETEKEPTFEEGQAYLNECKKIVEMYLPEIKKNKWHESFMNIIEGLDEGYSHIINVSCLSSLFSIATDIGDSYDMAIAGLLHDIGYAEVPSEILYKKAHERTLLEKKELEKHPIKSVEMVKKKKIILPEKSMKAILQHHEYFNGKGYPEGNAGKRIIKEAQILGLANEVEEFSCSIKSKKNVTKQDYVNYFEKMLQSSQEEALYDLEIIRKILNLLKENSR